MHRAGHAFETTRLGTLAVDGRHGSSGGTGTPSTSSKSTTRRTRQRAAPRDGDRYKAITATWRAATSSRACPGRSPGGWSSTAGRSGFRPTDDPGRLRRVLGIGFKSLYRARSARAGSTSWPPPAADAHPGSGPPLLHRQALQGPDHFDALAQELVLQTEEPEGYFLDGEIYAARAGHHAGRPWRWRSCEGCVSAL